MPPAPFDALEATLGPAARVVPLDEIHVVRTPDRDDHAPGNAVHHLAGLGVGELAAAVADLDRRFPQGRARLVAPWDDEVAGAALALPLSVAALDVGVRGAAHDAATIGIAGRDDLRLSPPRDERGWHGITVLHRHAGPVGEDRGRGAADERLRWWTEGLRRLVAEGRARVLRAERFGTPVGVGVLHWAPAAEVGPDHAGLAVVAGVVVHPAHRRLGVATTLVEALVEQHLADFPRACIAGVVEHGEPGVVPPADQGSPVHGPWRHHARLLAVTRPAGGSDGGRR